MIDINTKVKYRIKKENNLFYPQYYESWFFGLFEWWYFYEENLVLNGAWTELVKDKVYFTTEEAANNYIQNK